MVQLSAEPAALSDLRHHVAAWARFTGTAREDLMLATSELLANAIVHGPDDGRITVSARRLGGGAVCVEVSDEGHLDAIARRQPDDHGGRGLHIVHAVAQAWGIHPRPTRAWFHLEPHDHDRALAGG